MARIRSRERRGGTRVVAVSGLLGAGDLRRLERACGRSLEHEVPPLTVLLSSPTADPAARAFLARLTARGAVVRFPPSPAEESLTTRERRRSARRR